MAAEEKKGPSYLWTVGFFVVVIAVSAFNIAAGDFPWLAMPFLALGLVALIARVKPDFWSQLSGRSVAQKPLAPMTPPPEIVAQATELKAQGKSVDAVRIVLEATRMADAEAEEFVRGL